MTLSETIREQLGRASHEKAIQFQGEWLDRGWIRKRVEELEAAIRATGVPDNAPIGFVPHSRPEFAAALLALFAFERPIVMFYAYQSAEALAGKLREMKLPVVIASKDQWTEPTLQVARETGMAAVALNFADPGIETLTSWSPRPEQRAVDPEPGIALLSSGTTGPPKHIHLSYAQLHGRMVVNTAFAATGAIPMLSFFPLGNISGVYLILPALAVGQPIIMVDKFSVADWVDFVREYRPTTQNLPPAAFRMILDAKVDPADLSSLKSIATGAATLDPALRREFESHYGIFINQAYGATEFGGVVAIVQPAEREQYGDAVADSVGRACPGARLRVVDPETGEELPPNTEGRLEVVAPGMMTDEWIPTTDLVSMDENGFLFHRGRLDGAIMRGGFKLLPEQISEAIMTHPAVATAAVVGVPDERLGMVPAALIQLRDGASAPSQADIDAHIRAQLPATYVPKFVRFTNKLPRTPSLKIDLAAVRAEFASQEAA